MPKPWPAGVPFRFSFNGGGGVSLKTDGSWGSKDGGEVGEC